MRCHEKGPVPERGSLGNAWVVESSLLLGTLGALGGLIGSGLVGSSVSTGLVGSRLVSSGLIGGLGLLPSSNLGEEYAMFEAVHGSAPDIAGKGIANPTALLWSACMMLEYLGQMECAAKIRKSVDRVLEEGKFNTPDIGGTATIKEYIGEIIRLL